jgi:hypothetical protein
MSLSLFEIETIVAEWASIVEKPCRFEVRRSVELRP